MGVGDCRQENLFIFRMTELWEMGKGLCKGGPLAVVTEGHSEGWKDPQVLECRPQEARRSCFLVRLCPPVLAPGLSHVFGPEAVSAAVLNPYCLSVLLLPRSLPRLQVQEDGGGWRLPPLCMRVHGALQASADPAPTFPRVLCARSLEKVWRRLRPNFQSFGDQH